MFNIDWKPDRNNPLQLHAQIAEYIKGKIVRNEWPEGTKLPSQRTLAQIFGVNRSTIVEAFEELTAEGLIKGNMGGGTKIINSTCMPLSSKSLFNWSSHITSGAYQPSQTIMQQINQSESDPDIIRMGTCEPSPELIPSGMIQGILNKMSKHVIPLGYGELRGSIYLRKEICAYMKTIGVDTEPSCILVTSGALQALQIISLGLLHKGSVVYLEKPSYLYSLRIFQSSGFRLSGIPLDEEGINIKELLIHQKQSRGSMMFLIPTFHNPTGNVMSLGRRKQLIKLCEAEHLPVVEDDVYRELWFDNPPPNPLKAFDKSELVLYIGGISKNLSPGLRIGWIVGPEQVIMRLADIKLQMDDGSSAVSQYIAAELFSSGLYYEHNIEMRRNVKVRRDVTLAALNKYFAEIATWSIPVGSYYVWLKLNNSISMYKFFIKALKKKILIHPGDLYEFRSNRYIRISYSYASLSEIEYSIKTLSELVMEQLK